MMKKRCGLIVFCLAWMVSAICSAQAGLPPGSAGQPMGAGMATREVAAFLTLERGLLQAFQDGDRDAAAHLIDEGFGAHSARTADEQGKEDWLDAQFANPLKTARVYNLSVREFDGLAAVSFILDGQRNAKGKRSHVTLYVVDLWEHERLLARYATTAGARISLPEKPDGRG
jgi:hypothetical protein